VVPKADCPRCRVLSSSNWSLERSVSCGFQSPARRTVADLPSFCSGPILTPSIHTVPRIRLSNFHESLRTRLTCTNPVHKMCGSAIVRSIENAISESTPALRQLQRRQRLGFHCCRNPGIRAHRYRWAMATVDSGLRGATVGLSVNDRCRKRAGFGQGMLKRHLRCAGTDSDGGADFRR
jgi:hypothetical protein